MKNLQTNIYLALFSDFEYLVSSQSYKIFIRVSSEKTYCSKLTSLRGRVCMPVSPLVGHANVQNAQNQGGAS